MYVYTQWESADDKSSSNLLVVPSPKMKEELNVKVQ